jgi:hypothetical protein
VTEENQDTELDPAMERVRQKLTRLLLVSAGIMGLGFVAVLVAVIYRVSEDTARFRDPVATDVPVAPEDVRSVSASADNLVIVVDGEDPRVEVRRLEDGALIGTFRLTGEETER